MVLASFPRNLPPAVEPMVMENMHGDRTELHYSSRSSKYLTCSLSHRKSNDRMAATLWPCAIVESSFFGRTLLDRGHRAVDMSAIDD